MKNFVPWFRVLVPPLNQWGRGFLAYRDYILGFEQKNVALRNVTFNYTIIQQFPLGRWWCDFNFTFKSFWLDTFFLHFLREKNLFMLQIKNHKNSTSLWWVVKISHLPKKILIRISADTYNTLQIRFAYPTYRS